MTQRMIKPKEDANTPRKPRIQLKKKNEIPIEWDSS